MSVVDEKGPVEKKVTASTIGAYIASTIGLAILLYVGNDPTELSPLPDVIEPLIVSILPAGIAFLSGYRAKHTFRTDRQAARASH